jgi:hypothetical protein
VASIDQQAVEPVLQNRPDPLPIDPGRLHRNLRHPLRLQPIAQAEQPGDGRRELRQHLRTPAFPLGHTHARSHLRLVHVQPCGALDDHLHRSPPFDDETAAARTEPQETASLMSVLEGNSPAYREGSNAKLSTGSQHHRVTASTGDPTILPISPARAWPRRP